MTRTDGWYQASDGYWYYGQNPQAFTAPPRRNDAGGWTDPIPLASGLAGAPPPVAARPRRRAWPIGLAALAGLVLGVVVGSAAGDPETAELRTANERLTRELTALRQATQTPSPTPSPSPTPTETPTTAPPATPREFARFTGTTSQRTRAFEVPSGAEWELCYTMRGEGNNAVFLEDPPGQPSEVLVNEIGAIRGCTHQFEGGRFSLDITANGPWTMVIREQRAD